jgi:aminopeptidase YwaD
MKKIPVLFFWTGYHPDYHKPTDTADKINVAGMRKIVDMSEEVVHHFATVAERPDYVAGKVNTRGGGSNGPRLGFTPDYGKKDDKGIWIADVREGMPAAKAGLKGGDHIVELAGKGIKDLQGYMDVMSEQKAGTTIEAVIERDGKKMTVKIKLE